MISLKEHAKEIRKRILDSIHFAGAGHIGPSLSWADIATTLFFKEMKLSAGDERGKLVSSPVKIGPREERDIFVLSKGHAVPTLYSALSVLNPEYISEDKLKTLRDINSDLEGHPVAGSFPLVDASTGSLGQGLSIAQGYSLSNKLQGRDSIAYVVLGDGETQKGQVFEAAMSAAKFANQGRLSGLIAVLDYNKFQGDGSIKDTMPSLEPVKEKWESFGWYVQEVDGHNHEQLLNAYENARQITNKPSMIIANTTKGKGVSFMEQDPIYWHGGALTNEFYEKAISEVNKDA